MQVLFTGMGSPDDAFAAVVRQELPVGVRGVGSRRRVRRGDVDLFRSARRVCDRRQHEVKGNRLFIGGPLYGGLGPGTARTVRRERLAGRGASTAEEPRRWASSPVASVRQPRGAGPGGPCQWGPRHLKAHA